MISINALHKALPQLAAEDTATWLDVAKGGGPVGQAAAVLETVLIAAPRDLPDREMLEGAGIAGAAEAHDGQA